ncbi:MAG: YaaR family protein [Bacillota bacterium]
MRVKDIQSVAAQIPTVAIAEDKKGSGSFEREFNRRMTHYGNLEYEKYVKELQDKIAKQGELIGQKADIAAYQKYRELIIELLNQTASNAYALGKSEKFDSRGRHKVFMVIRLVNKKLDELASQILNDEQDRLTMLNLVDDIRGMLVDLFL